MHAGSKDSQAQGGDCRGKVSGSDDGGNVDWDTQKANVDYALDLGVVIKDGGVLRPANPIYQEMIGRYLSYGKQQMVAL